MIKKKLKEIENSILNPRNKKIFKKQKIIIKLLQTKTMKWKFLI